MTNYLKLLVLPMLYIYSQKNHRFKLNKKTEKVGLRSI